MPNWAENDLYIYGSNVRLLEVRRHMETVDEQTDDRRVQVFDFNKLIPRPKSYAYVASPVRQVEGAYSRYLAWRAGIKGDDETALMEAVKLFEASGSEYDRALGYWEPTELGRQAGEYLAILNKAVYGYDTWYEWSIQNWGTKWNACEATATRTKSSLRYKFSTPWSGPHPVIRKMSERWPELRIIHKVYEGGQQYKEVVKYNMGVQVEYEKSKYCGTRGG